MARRSSQKRRRDPNAPKRTKTAWQMFYSDNRDEVKKQNPNFSTQEMMKKLGEMWRQSDDNTKLRYQKQYQSGQAEYNEKLAAYNEEKKQKSQSSNSKKSSGQSKKENNNNNNNNNDETNEYNDQL